MSLQGEWKRFFQILVILAFTGCASENYLFLPASVVDHTERGKAYYPIPPKAPTGTVRTMSGGVVQLKPNEDGTKFPALYVRMVLSNQSSKIPWTVNPQKQTVAFPNGGSPISPVFVQSGSMSSSSTLVVNQGEMKVLDLYFSLPKV